MLHSISVCVCVKNCKMIIVVYLSPLSSDEPKSKLKVKVSPSLSQILEKMEISEKQKQEKLGELTLLITPHIKHHHVLMLTIL